MFNVHIQSTPVMGTGTGLQWFLCPGQEKKRGLGIQAVQPESVAGGGCFDVLWNLECPIGLSQKRNMCTFQ